jgi:DNA-directed RNA polymerase specialized sigma24 family protein
MLAPPETKFEEILAVHQALDELAKIDAPLAELVEMTYFGGVTIPAIAEIRQLSERTIIRQLNLAKGALKKILALRCPDEAFFRAKPFD